MVNNIEKTKIVGASMSRVSFFFFLLLITDLIWLGTGEYWRVLVGFSLRHVIFSITILFSIPLVLSNIRGLLENKPCVYVWGFLCYVLFALLWGTINNNNLKIMQQDLSGYMNFLIFPTVICLLSSYKNILCTMKVIFANCVALSLVSLYLVF
ncbi:MAG: hypothetical protein Q4B70_18400, partial [Lachnospiraceae bacterium]|nr:hypothetical protein [Lachnospiraceae bacterium]